MAPTVSVELYLPSVNLSEYDCVITGGEYLRVDMDVHPREAENRGRYSDPPTWWRWRQEFPPHVSIFRIIERSRTVDAIADMRPSEGEGESLGQAAVFLETHVPGRDVRYARGLPDDITELVKRHLAPAAQDRKDHITISVRSLEQEAEHEPETTTEPNPFKLTSTAVRTERRNSGGHLYAQR